MDPHAKQEGRGRGRKVLVSSDLHFHLESNSFPEVPRRLFLSSDLFSSDQLLSSFPWAPLDAREAGNSSI